MRVSIILLLLPACALASDCTRELVSIVSKDTTTDVKEVYRVPIFVSETGISFERNADPAGVEILDECGFQAGDMVDVVLNASEDPHKRHPIMLAVTNRLRDLQIEFGVSLSKW